MSIDRPIHTTITMLGAQGIGKTSFLVAMSAVMREDCPNGFTFSTDADTDLKLDGSWNTLVLGSDTNRWPSGTKVDEATRYPFRFNHGLTKRIVEFDWLDYRGAALNDAASAADMKLLRERLLKTDCVMLCVSGEDLAEAGRDRVARSRALIPRLLLFLTDLAEQPRAHRPDLPLVVIVVTKYDHCKSRNRAELIDQVKGLFGPLFVPGAGWLVAICPVTLGQELAADVNKGAINPENVHVPVAFAAHCRLQEEVDQLDAVAADHRKKATEDAAKRSAAEDKASQLGDNWFKRTVWNPGEIAAQQREAERLRTEVETALRDASSSDANRIELLSKVRLVVGKLIPPLMPVFDNGREVPRE